jgi:hypothetical protein
MPAAAFVKDIHEAMNVKVGITDANVSDLF